MRVVPRNKVPQIAYFRSHLAKWTENALEIGTSPELVALLAEQTEVARVAFLEQQRAQAAARSATLRFHEACEAMALTGGSILLQIRSQARRDGSKVFALAQVRRPGKPSPIGEPGTPFRLKTKLGAGGTLMITWRCDNPRGSVGTMYHVSRQIGYAGPFEFLGAVGQRRFVDETIPPGTAFLVYRIQAVRSTKAGESADFPVSFGAGRPSSARFVPKAA